MLTKPCTFDKVAALTLLADRTLFTFVRANSFTKTHSFNCLVSVELWLIHVSLTVMKWYKNLFTLRLNDAKYTSLFAVDCEQIENTPHT